MKKLLAICLLLSSCSSNEFKQKGLDKWNGEWVAENGEEQFLETWQPLHTTEMSGYGALVLSGDTVFSEHIRLISENGDIFYVVSTKENNNVPVRFKLTTSNATKWVFENPSHDFPTKITYKLETENALTAIVEGPDKKGTQNFTLQFKRK